MYLPYSQEATLYTAALEERIRGPHHTAPHLWIFAGARAQLWRTEVRDHSTQHWKLWIFAGPRKATSKQVKEEQRREDHRSCFGRAPKLDHRSSLSLCHICERAKVKRKQLSRSHLNFFQPSASPASYFFPPTVKYRTFPEPAHNMTFAMHARLGAICTPFPPHWRLLPPRWTPYQVQARRAGRPMFLALRRQATP
jgi:hypothetical protein